MDKSLARLKLRIIQLDANEAYYSMLYNKPLIIKNSKTEFHSAYRHILPPNLDTNYLDGLGKLNRKEVNTRSNGADSSIEYYSDTFINVSFDRSLYIDENGNMLDGMPKSGSDIRYTTTKPSTLRSKLYKEGFYVNKKHYVRYKRSSGAAKSGSCLFIDDKVSKTMDRWSRMGLDEEGKCFDQLTSFEAYKSLSLSSLVKLFSLNPYNILFVKDLEVTLKKQDVIKVYLPEDSDYLVANDDVCDITNSIFDGEGLMDVSVFERIKKKSKGMALLRNRYFKCCAFNTNLQQWFKDNDITDVSELEGITFANKVDDIVLVASESCLKYLKLCETKDKRKAIRKWCDEVVNSSDKFGIVKYDKPTRFFNGEMVETTYQLLNTINLKNTDFRRILANYSDYIADIKNIKDKPECIRYYLEGEFDEVNEEDGSEDDSEDTTIDEIARDVLKYSSDTFKNKVCLDLIKIDERVKETDVFKQRVYRNILESFSVKLFNGRLLVNGTYATLFGNPYEYLLYIIKKLDTQHPKSLLRNGEIYSPFFPDGVKLLGSRAPHTTMGNILISTNKHLSEVDKYFNLTKQIVVVDAINNNIQHRLSGCDYDSDTVLLTDNETLVKCANSKYKDFKVPFAAYSPSNTTPINRKESIIENLIRIDNKIATNNVGKIVNLSQRLNSFFWDEYNKTKLLNPGLYKQIALLSVLSGAEIDSAKRNFPFVISDQIKSIDEFRRSVLGESKPFFWRILDKENGHRPNYSTLTASRDENEKPFNTPMDILWSLIDLYRFGDIQKVKSRSFYDCIEPFNSYGVQGDKYDQVEKAYNSLQKYEDILNDYKDKKKNNDYEVNKSDFYHQIDQAYKQIHLNINNINKARMLIRYIDEHERSYTKLFILLFIIDSYHKELGYELKDLFRKNVKPLPTLTALKDTSKKADYAYFGKFNYVIRKF